MKKSIIALGALALAAFAAAPAEARVRAGMLTCQVSPGVSFIVGSQKTLDCRFKSALGYSERYAGRMTRVGLDVGFTTGGTIVWAVYAPSRPGPGALAGGYAGASAEATVAGGLDANALFGGFQNSIALQPLSVGVQQGLDVAAGVSSVELDFVR